MRRLAVSVLLSSAVSLPLALRAETERSAAISRDNLAAHINYLASDELGGRGVNSKGIDQAAEYIARRFLDVGLLPGGDDGSYFQRFELPGRTRITDRCRLEVAGKRITCEVDEDCVPMPFSSQDEFEGQVAFVGYGITNHEKNYDDYADINVQGKVALMLRYEPQRWKDENQGQLSSHASFTTKANLAKENGAVAVVIVNPPTKEEDELYRFRRPRPGALPMFHITRRFANRILAAGGLSPVEDLYDTINASTTPDSADLSGIALKGDPGLESNTPKAKNVIGVLPGEGPLADEYVVFGGHYDHLGTVPSRRGRRLGDSDASKAQIHNGADDNASGTAGVLELARIYACGAKPRRSLVFMGFTAEEIGLLGSAHFAANPTVPLEDIVAMINLDMIGRLEGRPVEIWGTGTATEFGALIDKNAQAIPNLKVNNMAEMRRDSDHASFYAKDIPVMFAFSGFHPDYHRPSDDCDKIDYDGAVAILQFVHAVADDVIEADDRPTFQEVPMRSRFDVRVRMGFRPEPAGETDIPGLGVVEVTPDNPAAQAGIKAGDRIVAINKQQIKDIMDYMRVMRSFKPGDEVDVTVTRGDLEVTVKVKLSGR